MECPICLENKLMKDTTRLSCCAHSVCTRCLSTHARTCLMSRKPVVCPAIGCRAQLEERDCRAILNPSDCDKAMALLAELSIAEDEKFYCPYRDCSALMFFEREPVAGHRRQQAALGFCRACYRGVCTACREPWHESGTCEQHLTGVNPVGDSSEARLRQLAHQEGWKQCYKCGRLVERASGCNHMTCKCGAHFCYMCGLPWMNCRGARNCSCSDYMHNSRPRLVVAQGISRSGDGPCNPRHQQQATGLARQLFLGFGIPNEARSSSHGPGAPLIGPTSQGAPPENTPMPVAPRAQEDAPKQHTWFRQSAAVLMLVAVGTAAVIAHTALKPRVN